MALPASVADWHIPISQHNVTLAACRQRMQPIQLHQHDIPLIVQLAENPKYSLGGMQLITGGTNLKQHDDIHIVLGRGLLAKDEAFVLGFTMGSTHHFNLVEQNLYGLFSQFLYPKAYRFDQEDFFVFKQAVHLAKISQCQPLPTFNFDQLAEKTLFEIRQQLAIEVDLLEAYYRIEQRRFPNAQECQRLLN